MTSYAVARLDEIEELTDGREPFRPVRHHFGITSFGVNAWTAHDVGDRIINEHDESEPDAHEELYLVVSGRAVFELDGDRVDAPAGTLVFAPPGVKRTAFAEEPETTLLALGGTPGKAYEPDGWELWAPLNPLYQAGEYAEAADRGRELVEAHPQYAGLFYNLACCESLAGRTMTPLSLLASHISAAMLPRVIDKYKPTLLLDEVDTYMRDDENVRRIMNAGFDPVTFVIVGVPTADGWEDRALIPYCPQALAGIGDLPGTIPDRSIRIVLDRKPTSAKVARLRRRDADKLLPYARKVARWADDNVEKLVGANPDIPDGLQDRAKDAWSLCLAIAELAGGEWPQRARDAALILSGDGASRMRALE